MTLIRSIILLLAASGLAPLDAQAHALDPGFLEISQVAGDSYRVAWRKPDVQGTPMAIEALLPETCSPASPPEAASDGRAWRAVWVAVCPGGLEGGVIRIPGLSEQRTDVLVRYQGPGGQILSERLTPDRAAFTVPTDPGAWDVLKTYVPLGVDHILEGVDHLLFVFALLLLIPDRWRLVGAITAFTLAHSLTMAAATLGWVTLPGPPVEAVIALSIMFVAAELLQRDGSNARLSERYPWTVTFSFGLLHGFGFAGALRDIGLPQSDVPLALLSFNLGVEIGQLVFVFAILGLAWSIRRAVPTAQNLLAAGTTAATVSAYAIGGVSAFWFLERVSGF